MSLEPTSIAAQLFRSAQLTSPRTSAKAAFLPSGGEADKTRAVRGSAAADRVETGAQARPPALREAPLAGLGERLEPKGSRLDIRI
ncbi:MAG: hypothetical protein H6923_00490 [Alphaproteobacteria bacterium]|nr:hypothetical protein [Alphaproteobacteria bacterium]